MNTLLIWKITRITTYRYRMHQEDLAKQFGRWYRKVHNGGKTVCLLGMRADESLQRYSGFLNKKYGYKIPAGSANNLKMSGVPHLYMIGQSMMCGMPIIYLIMIITIYMIFIIWQVSNRHKCVWLLRSMTMLRTLLNLYRVIDPEIWSKLVVVYMGANFAAIYGKTKAMGYPEYFLAGWGIRGKTYTIFHFGYITKKTAK